MISEKQLLKTSKFLSLVLRHQPEIIGLELDQNGWVDINDLLQKSNNHGQQLDRHILNHIVATNSKKRFAFNDNLDKIRASQGHSIEIELGYTNQKPPTLLFHGTSEQSVQSIQVSGLEKRNRQHVHLSSQIETAINVGKRHGKPVVFKVQAEQMYLDNYAFFFSDNCVWLTECVPPKYLKRMEE